MIAQEKREMLLVGGRRCGWLKALVNQKRDLLTLLRRNIYLDKLRSLCKNGSKQMFIVLR